MSQQFNVSPDNLTLAVDYTCRLRNFLLTKRLHQLRVMKCKWRVESRTGAVTVVSRWLVDWAFASSPQSGLAWSCFLFPLIEPDWQFSRIRLSEKTHAFAHGRFAVRCGNWTKPYTEFRDASGKRL